MTPVGCAMPRKEDDLTFAVVLRQVEPYQAEAATTKVVDSMAERDTGMTVTF